ncbi:SDR family NAD(P)-dependent oxidoreductase [Noviherbaspirillum sp. Root189]|uniref:SDR family NAD(P)-dependent oxidoreductase n=1 Tax=Noviherbaspirillum sp. Root189 TaxID=1736487 RepID=UPI00070BFCF8|nr:SDR family NAD(P)-dependent oxidoreductase [Noviherbaspirillum sp. Root189]KRB92306.1 3-hydroxyacyl-CoA dehydrogenase [Noviherbaspirillum sp. Root189]
MTTSAQSIAPIRFDGKVAIVTGAGGGLGRSHALQLAARGARVVVNDLGVARDGSGNGMSPAEKVVAEIREAGGQAIASAASVTDPAAVQEMVEQVMREWGRIDILVNNAGFLRDKSFSKMTLDDFRAIVDVHLMGAVYCTKAVWEIMKQQNYGRIVMTTSSSGLFGNFGQANYGAAKMALVGLMQTLGLEGEKYDIRVNCLAPTAATRMTEDLMPPEVLALLTPESVTPGMLYLASADAPNKMVLCAGAGTFSRSNITLTDGVHIGERPDAVEQLVANAHRLQDRSGEIVPVAGFQQGQMEVTKAREGKA